MESNDSLVASGLLAVAIATFAFWRAWQLPHVRAALPGWVWPAFWVSTLGAVIAFAIFWAISR